jgi:hypothetical protein
MDVTSESAKIFGWFCLGMVALLVVGIVALLMAGGVADVLRVSLNCHSTIT